jgi:hypothetical protein
VDDSVTCAGFFTEKDSNQPSASTVFVIDKFVADSATQPNGTTPIACVGEYSIGRVTGGIRFTVTVPSGPTPAPSLSDVYLDGNA